jgi:hypothetical protein
MLTAFPAIDRHHPPGGQTLLPALNAYHWQLERHRMIDADLGFLCIWMKKPAQMFSSTVNSGLDAELTTTAIVNLDAEYRLTRAALVNAGVDMTDSMDALYRDWRRWRDKSKSLAGIDRVGLADVDQWWARHLAQFRSLIDPLHVAARAERARKDGSAVRARPRHAGGSRSPLVLDNTLA